MIVRLYLVALTLLFLTLTLAFRSLGYLEAVVVICPVLFVILDLADELKQIKTLEARLRPTEEEPL